MSVMVFIAQKVLHFPDDRIWASFHFFFFGHLEIFCEESSGLFPIFKLVYVFDSDCKSSLCFLGMIL